MSEMLELASEPLLGFLRTSNNANLVDVDKKYVFIRLGASSEERPYVEIFTQFIGFEDTERKIEFREPSPAKPAYLIELWQRQGLEYFIANTAQEAFFFRLLGGLALIEIEASKIEFPEHWKALSSVKTGAFGFRSKEDLDENTFHKAPSPKKRMKILNRDERKCRICGRNPEKNSDIELHLHHIRPWAKGGVTDPENLITLCHTCHKGLEPHFDVSLFNYTSAKSLSLSEYAEKIRYETNVYRSQMLKILNEGFKSPES